MPLLPKGTIRILWTCPSHYYVKIDNEDFGWWISETRPNIKDEYKMQVRMTDEMVLNESHFNVFVPALDYLEPEF
jgi:hypothetical protein